MRQEDCELMASQGHIIRLPQKPPPPTTTKGSFLEVSGDFFLKLIFFFKLCVYLYGVCACEYSCSRLQIWTLRISFEFSARIVGVLKRWATSLALRGYFQMTCTDKRYCRGLNLRPVLRELILCSVLLSWKLAWMWYLSCTFYTNHLITPTTA